MQIYDEVEATFNPKRIDDIKTKMIPFIGGRFNFIANWVIDKGEYKGQLALSCTSDNGFPYWVPESDLSDIKLINI